MKAEELFKNIELTKEQEEYIKKYLGIKDKKWKPEFNEEYFYIDDCGDIDSALFDNNDYGISINNIFKTKEEAEFRLEQIKVYNELKNFADENNDNIKDYRFLISLQSGNLEINSYTYLHYIGEIGFSSEELAKQAIEKVDADKIKKYLFGVE